MTYLGKHHFLPDLHFRSIFYNIVFYLTFGVLGSIHHSLVLILVSGTLYIDLDRLYSPLHMGRDLALITFGVLSPRTQKYLSIFSCGLLW